MKKTVCLLYGGKSGEHEVSRQSAASIVKNLNRDKFDLIAIGIKKDNTWHFQEEVIIENHPQRGDYLAIKEDKDTLIVMPGKGIFYHSRKLKIDIVFPILHGTFGEDGTMQGFLEIINLPYIGAGVLGSALSMDKEKVKIQWRAKGLPVPDFLAISKSEFRQAKKSFTTFLGIINEKFVYPLFVKPVSLGSSVGIKKVEKEEDLINALRFAFQFDNKVLIEQGVKAREIECAVVGNENPHAFPPGEVIPHHSFYNYEAKYLDPNGATLQIPAQIPDFISEKVIKYAEEAYKCAGVSGFARVDLFYDEKSNILYLNEINTIPGFTQISMFPRMCAAAGLSYPDVIEKLIELGIKRFKERNRIEYSI